jgi:hypothetical protein
MRYMLLIYLDEKGREQVDPKTREATYGAYMAYRDAIVAAGAFVASGQLQPSASATTLRGDRDTIEVLDGPFAETKEQLAGFFMIDVANLDAALDWAKRCPAVNGNVVEVRPMVPIPAST